MAVGFTLPQVPSGLVFRHDPKRPARLGLFGARRLVQHEVAGGVGFFEVLADYDFGYQGRKWG